MDKDNSFKNDPLYSREINTFLLNNYNISITPQMLGQHLKQLLEADLIKEVARLRSLPALTAADLPRERPYPLPDALASRIGATATAPPAAAP